MKIRLTYEYVTGRHTGGGYRYRAIDLDAGRALLTAYNVDDLHTALAAANLHPDDMTIYLHRDGDHQPAASVQGTYYALRADTGEMREDFASPDAAASWLAGELGVERAALHLADRSSSAGSVIQYEVTRAGETVGTIGSNDELGLPPGAAERAVEAVRAAGVL